MKIGKDPGSPWRVGCAGFSMRLSKYFERFDVVEVQESFYDPPTERTLGKWRRAAPEGFAFTMRAWQLITHPASYSGYQRIRRPWDKEARDRFGLFQSTEQTKWAWGIVRRAAEILDAKAIVFHTPSSFTPTRENRENFARFFGSLERGPYHLAWEPDGMWEDEEIEALCREFGLIAVIDPLVCRPCSGEAFYFRIREKTRGRGAHGEDDFFQIHSRAVAGEERVGEGFFIWNTRDAVGDAHRFRKWCQSA
jgi:uncharacterized protein YecE (DUF72 family)